MPPKLPANLSFRPQNLNECFQEALAQVKQKLPELSHNRQVSRLYRHSLRALLNWTIDRDIFNTEATELRQRFDANRGVNMAAAHRLLQEGHDELHYFMHPDPYTIPTMPGGSKFMRYSPPPMSVCFPDGVGLPADAPRYEINPDWSVATPESGRNATGTVIVDFSKKTME